MDNNAVVIYVISDSVGETGELIAKSSVKQFESYNYEIKRYPYHNSVEQIEPILEEASKHKKSLIVYTNVVQETRDFIECKAKELDLHTVDVMGGPMDQLEDLLGYPPLREPGLIRRLDENYFKKVEAIEFAVKYDDGKDPRGLLKADLVLVGISRTSKTPLSMYLANKHIKVANVPLVPEVPIPKELDSVEPRRIIGLTNSPEKLNVIRTERLKAMGLNGSANYAKLDRILEELDYSEEVMKRLKCPVINVANKAIEETAGIILDILKESDVDILKDYEI